jgi:histidinol-phosphate aminotransferase
LLTHREAVHGASLPTPEEATMVRTRSCYQGISLYAPSSTECQVNLSDSTNLFGVPPAAERVLREGTAATITCYPHSYAQALKKALSAHTGFEPAWITTGCGSADIIDSALRAFLEPGERVACPDPTFVMMPHFAKVNGLQYTPVPLKPDFDIDVEGLLATGARLIYVCSPNNPTGTVATRASLERLVDAAPGVVLLDEAYVEFANASAADMARTWPNVLVTRTFSKAFGLAGMRVGYVVGHPALVAEVEKSLGPYKISALAESMAAAVLTEDWPWVKRRAMDARENRKRLVAGLKAQGLAPLPSETNFVLVPQPGASRIAARMRELGVNVRAFQRLTGVGDALRIGCGPWPMMKAALDALREARR